MLGNGHDKRHQRNRTGTERVHTTVFFRQPVGNAKAGDNRHDVVGRFDRIQQLVAPGRTEYLPHQVGIARDRQVGEDQEK
ncbi:hypothetical protein D3C72_2346390 [compost metagenome]